MKLQEQENETDQRPLSNNKTSSRLSNVLEHSFSCLENPKVKQIISIIQEAGGNPYIVGGAVRDQISGVDSKDIDFLVENLPLKEMKKLMSSIGSVSIHGKSKMLLKVYIDGEEFDITTPGERFTSYDLRKIASSLGSDSECIIKADLAHRDFTINAMAIRPDGSILDIFDGQQDLHDKKICTVGDAEERFTEDPLRILRAIQFAVRFGFQIEDKTLNIIKDPRFLEKLKDIDANRINTEILKSWTKSKEINTDDFFNFLTKTGVGNCLFGDVFFSMSIGLKQFEGDEKIYAGFISFFFNGGKHKNMMSTKKMVSYLNVFKALISDKSEPWEYAANIRDRFVFYKKLLLEFEQKHWFSKIEDKIWHNIDYIMDETNPLSWREMDISIDELNTLGIKGEDISIITKKLLSVIYNGYISNNKKEIIGYINTLATEGLEASKYNIDMIDKYSATTQVSESKKHIYELSNKLVEGNSALEDELVDEMKKQGLRSIIHCEGPTVWDHVYQMIKKIDSIKINKDKKRILKVLALYHDLGKTDGDIIHKNEAENIKRDERVDYNRSFIGHENLSSKQRLKLEEALLDNDIEQIEDIIWVIENHLRFLSLDPNARLSNTIKLYETNPNYFPYLLELIMLDSECTFIFDIKKGLYTAESSTRKDMDKIFTNIKIYDDIKLLLSTDDTIADKQKQQINKFFNKKNNCDDIDGESIVNLKKDIQDIEKKSQNKVEVPLELKNIGYILKDKTQQVAAVYDLLKGKKGNNKVFDDIVNGLLREKIGLSEKQVVAVISLIN